MIAAQLIADHKIISASNRAQLLDDTFVLASVEIVPYKVALELSMYLKNETEYVPWNAVSSELDYIDSMLHNEPQYPDWKVMGDQKIALYIYTYVIDGFSTEIREQFGRALLRFTRLQRVQNGCPFNHLLANGCYVLGV